MSARAITTASLLFGLAVAGLGCGTGFPCDGVNGPCLGLTITSTTIPELDTLSFTASGAFSGTHSSVEGHPAPLPIRVRASYPTGTSGTVHVDVTGMLGGAVVGHGAGDAEIRPGIHTNIVIPLVPGTVTLNDMAIGGGSTDMAVAGGSTDMAVRPGADLKPGPDLYRQTLSFTPKGPYNIGPNPVGVVLGNLQNKGNVDIVAANQDGTMPGASVLLQDAMGNYPASPINFAGTIKPVQNVGVGHISSTDAAHGIVYTQRFNFAVVRNNPAGTFSSPASYPGFQLSPNFAAFALGDVNSDNFDDLVFGTSNADVGAAPAIGVTFCDKAGSFQAGANATTAPPTYYATGPVGTSIPNEVVLGDLTGSGKLDIVTSLGGGTSANTILILHNNGSGGFTTNLTNDKHTVGSTPAGIVIADFDGNKRNDIAVANNGGTVSVLLNDGTGGFPTVIPVTAGMMPNGIAAADLDGDGNLDLVVTNSNNRVSVLLGDGQGQFNTLTPFAVGGAPSSVAAGDLNGDKKPDLVVTNQADGTVSVLINSSH